MNYEQKYKEALEWMKSLYNGLHGATKEEAEKYFPELKDSEDEQIRKGLIKALSSIGKRNWGGIDVFESIAWLEKQGEQKPIINVPSKELIFSIWDLGNEWKELTNGRISEKYGTQLNYIQKHWHESEYFLRGKQDEQKPPVIDFKAKNWYVSEVDGKIHDLTYNPTDKVEPKFKVGDWIVDNCNNVWQVVEVSNNFYRLKNINESESLPKIKWVNETFHLWSVKDAKDGDVIAFSNDTIVMFKNLYNSTTFHSYCHIEDGVFNISKDDMPDWWEGKGFYPATKEQREILMKAITDAGYEWNAEKKELKKIEDEYENYKKQVLSELEMEILSFFQDKIRTKK